MKRINKKVIISLVLVAVIAVGSFALFKNRKEIYINAVLTTKAYDYLPNEAKDFIKETYDKTGNVVLTEKNKEDNELYLNPMYVEYLTSTKEEQENSEIIPQALVVDYVKRELSGDGDEEEEGLPESYDIRYEGGNFTTPVRNQGKLGICWAFATSGAAESYILKSKNLSYDQAIDPPIIAERQLDYATATDSLVDYRSEYTTLGLRRLGGGGNFNIASLALANGISGVYANSFKEYDDTDLERMEMQDVLNYSYAQQELNFTTNMPRLSKRESTDGLTNEELATREEYLNTIKQKILNTGAAYVSTYMNQNCFVPNYGSSESKLIDVYNCETKNPHAMQIIGWDDGAEYEYCADTKTHTSNMEGCIRAVHGRGMWKLKNSWGSNYPYMYLAYDSMYSDISTIDNMAEKVNNKWAWDNNYVMGSGTEGLTNKVYRLEQLDRLKTEERLRKVKLFISVAGDYQIKVKQSNGSERTYTEHADQPGLVTFTYPTEIKINSNSQITVTAPGFIDSISLFTTNYNDDKTVDVSQYEGINISESSYRFYSETKNIEANQYLLYKVYKGNNVDVTNNLTISGNIVGENNVNTRISNLDRLQAGSYRVDIIYNNVTLVGRFTFNIVKMQGAGTQANPYVITNPSQLAQIKNNLSAYYVLGNDIDLTEATGEGGYLSKPSSLCPQGFGWEAISGFNGSLDGQGHKIIGLRQDNYISCNEENGTLVKEKNETGNGLFYKARGNVTIKNITFEDLNMNCQKEYCGVIISDYVANFNASGVQDYNDTTAYQTVFENIAIKNSKIYRKDGIGSSSVQGSGLFGVIQNTYGTVDISNIYIDLDISESMSEKSYLANYIQGRPATVKNIYVQGRNNPTLTDISVIYEAQALGSASISINNVVSTLTKETNLGTIVNYVRGTNYTIDNINMIDTGKPVCGSIDCETNATNIHKYNSSTQLTELTKAENYTSWSDFSTNWENRTVDGVKRIPMLKFANLETTSISNFTIDHELNHTYNIYDYITPKKESTDRLNFSSTNPNIFTIDSSGNITPQSPGNAYLHVESLYDGYSNDVIVAVNYQRHFTVEFKANGGSGTMDSVEIALGDSLTLPECGFTKEGYSFKNWNTKANGSGKTYADLGQVKTLNDKEVITLYAQWSGEQYQVTFNAKGGEVNPRTKIVRENEKYGDLPIPHKAGYGFDRWEGFNYGRVTSNTVLGATQLEALWVDNAYTIIYDANGASLEPEAAENDYYNTMSNSIIIESAHYDDEEKTPSECRFAKKGLTFKEWNTKADGTGRSYTEYDQIQVSDVNNDTLRLYAIWEKEAKYVILSREKLYISTGQIINVSAMIDSDVSSQYDTSNIRWETDDDGIAAVQNGTIRAYEPGRTTIYAFLPVGLESTIDVVVTSSPRQIIKGDVNYSGEVDIGDVITTLKKLFKYIPTDDEDKNILDVNNNRVVDIDDLIRIIKYLFKYIDEL